MPFNSLELTNNEVKKIKFGQSIEKFDLKCNNNILMLTYEKKIQAIAKMINNKIELEKVFV